MSKMTNETYDLIKDIALCWMPLVIAFYGVVSTAWGIPYGEPIMATLTGLNALLGGVVKYYKSKFDKANTEE
ncbi:MAG: phage holin [archaeon]|nr:phage holin [archaeon]